MLHTTLHSSIYIEVTGIKCIHLITVNDILIQTNTIISTTTTTTTTTATKRINTYCASFTNNAKNVHRIHYQAYNYKCLYILLFGCVQFRCIQRIYYCMIQNSRCNNLSYNTIFQIHLLQL